MTRNEGEMNTQEESPKLKRRLYPLAEAQDQLGGIGRTTLYQLAKSGQLQLVKIGARTFVTHKSLDSYIETLALGE